MKSRIKELAQERGIMRPEHLSKLVGLTKSTIYNVWTGNIGKRQFETMYQIARALDVPMEALIFDAHEGAARNVSGNNGKAAATGANVDVIPSKYR